MEYFALDEQQFAILMGKLKEIRCGLIDLENAVQALVNQQSNTAFSASISACITVGSSPSRLAPGT